VSVRLQYGDEGFLPFALAKNTFARTILDLLRAADVGTMDIFRGRLPTGVLVFS
jgi:hypothetical protein